MIDQRFYLRWIRASGLGWLLGVPCIAALALVGEAFGIGGKQVLVGAGMGVAVGWMQGRLLRRVDLQRTAPWIWSCVVGLALPFLVTDLASTFGWPLPYDLYVTVVVGGILTGSWQALLLRDRFPRAHWWVVVSALGWTLASATAAAADALFRSQHLRGVTGLVMYLALLSVGGLVLGVVTGPSLARRIPGSVPS